MPELPNIPTLGLCSTLSSLAFFGVFACLWVGRRDETHFLHWAGGSLIYAAAIPSFNHLAQTPFQIGMLYSGLSLSTLAVLTGVRRFDGRSPFRPWMLLPILASGLGYILPALAFGPDSAAPRIGGTFGSLLNMAIVGGTLAFGRISPPSRGRRIAGAALLAYIPGFLAAIAAEAVGGTATNMAALIPLVSDQMLLAVLNLGLIAMPGERAQAALREAALRDPLTGAWNRAGLAALGPRLLRSGTAVIALDVDHFKAINDRHGHAVGDRVLVALAACAQGVVPEPDACLIRLGGDEFVLLVPERSPAEARWLADEIRHAVARTDSLPAWTISLGIAVVEPGEADFSAAIERADRSLYRAKAQGRDRAAA
ncbi:GGDEF domain-containing protein [Methylobacterium sp. J-043]|nr:GGDEF domain-containing protein [Methylobacterium sp. J-043]